MNVSIKTQHGLAILASCFLLSLTIISQSWKDLTGTTSDAILLVPINSQLATLSEINSGLVGWWKFDEESGNIAADTSGNNNNGKMINGATLVAGKIGRAIQLSGSSQYVETGNTFTEVTKNQTKTISLWVKPNVSTSGFPICLVRTYGQSCGFAIKPNETWMAVYWTSTTGILKSDKPVSTQDWTHLALVQSGKNVTLYVNGEAVKSADNAGISEGSYQNFWIGAMGNEKGGSNFFNGTIDDVRIYSRALSQTEISDIYSLNNENANTTSTNTTNNSDTANNSEQQNITPATTFTLSISRQGIGQGTVTGDGINCGSICNQSNLNSGTTKTLTAIPDSNSTFTGWSGGNCSGIETCLVTITSDTKITASFAQRVIPTGPVTYYIDYDSGNDARDGISPETAWKHAPGDDKAIGNPKTTVLKPGDSVQFKGGVVYRGTVKISNANGTSDKPITYKGTGWGEGKAIISGSDLFPASSWKKCDSSCGPNWQNLYYTDISADYKFSTTDLFDDDQFLFISQDPNISDPFWSDKVSEFRTVLKGNITLTTIKDPTFLTQTDPHYWDGAYLLIWRNPNVIDLKKVTGFDPSSNTISFEAMTSNAIYGDRNQYYSIINSKSILDKPGEYYFDEANSKVYLWPLNSLNNIQIGARSRGIYIWKSDNIIIDGFIIEKMTGYSGAYAISDTCCVQSTKMTIRNNEVRYNRLRTAGNQGTLYLSYNDSVKYENNYIHDNRMTGILATRNVEVTNNVLKRNGYKGLWVMGGEKVKVTNNKFSEHSGTHATDVSIFTSKDVLFANNYIQCTSECISFEGARQNFIIHGNVIYNYKNAECGMIRLNGSDVKGNLIITNNTVYGSKNNISLNIVKSSTDPNVKYIIKNNILDGSGGGSSFMGFDISNNIYTGLAWVQVADKRYADPVYGVWHLKPEEFVELDLNKIFEKVGDVFSGGFRLKADSVAVDKGVDILPSIPSEIFSIFPDFDFRKSIDGAIRPQGSAWDIGAYEYYSGQPIIPPASSYTPASTNNNSSNNSSVSSSVNSSNQSQNSSNNNSSGSTQNNSSSNSATNSNGSISSSNSTRSNSSGSVSSRSSYGTSMSTVNANKRALNSTPISQNLTKNTTNYSNQTSYNYINKILGIKTTASSTVVDLEVPKNPSIIDFLKYSILKIFAQIGGGARRTFDKINL